MMGPDMNPIPGVSNDEPSLPQPTGRYERVTQLRFCCVPASLQMVLHRRGLPEFSQEEIGWELGLVVPPDVANQFSRVRVGERGPAGYGTRCDLPEFSVQAFFERNGLPLILHHLAPAEIASLQETLSALLENDCDVLACFDYGVLYGVAELKGCGHVSVINCTHSGMVELVETRPSEPPLRTVEAASLMEAMAIHGAAKLAGLWVIRA